MAVVFAASGKSERFVLAHHRRIDDHLRTEFGVPFNSREDVFVLKPSADDNRKRPLAQFLSFSGSHENRMAIHAASRGNRRAAGIIGEVSSRRKFEVFFLRSFRRNSLLERYELHVQGRCLPVVLPLCHDSLFGDLAALYDGVVVKGLNKHVGALNIDQGLLRGFGALRGSSGALLRGVGGLLSGAQLSAQH
jgi:hypothetical protein